MSSNVSAAPHGNAVCRRESGVMGEDSTPVAVALVNAGPVSFFGLFYHDSEETMQTFPLKEEYVS